MTQEWTVGCKSYIGINKNFLQQLENKGHKIYDRKVPTNLWKKIFGV